MKIFAWNKNLNPNWIKESITEEAIKWSEEFGYYLANEIKLDENKNPIQKKDKSGNPVFNKKGNPEYEKQSILTTSQLRKFFSQIRRIQAEIIGKDKGSYFDKSKLLLLKPKLAYQVGREKDKNGKIRDFYQQVSMAIDYVNDKESFSRFIDLVESIVAYHKVKESEKEQEE